MPPPVDSDVVSGGAWADVDLALVESKGPAVEIPVAGLGGPKAKFASVPRPKWNLFPLLLIKGVGRLASFT